MNEKDHDQKSWNRKPSTARSDQDREDTTEENSNHSRISQTEAATNSKDSRTVSEFIVSECGHVEQGSLLYKQVDDIVTLPKEPPRSKGASAKYLSLRWFAKPRIAAATAVFGLLAVVCLLVLFGNDSTTSPPLNPEQTLADHKLDAGDEIAELPDRSAAKKIIIPAPDAGAAEDRGKSGKGPGDKEDKDKKRDISKSKDIPLLLAVADAHLRAVRLTRPKRNNAFEVYNSVLALDPENKSAHKGIARIQQKYWELAETVAAKGQFKKAKEFLKSALQISPTSKEIQQAIARLDEREENREKAQKLIALAQKFVDDGKYLEARIQIDNAAQLLPTSPDIGAARERMEDQRTELSAVTLSPLKNEKKDLSIRSVESTFRDSLTGSGFGPEMVIIPAGSFQMGDLDGAGDSDERPIRQVDISKPFALGKYEVTFDEYDLFTRATGRPMADDNGWGRGKRPVVNITWQDAKAYTEWLSRETGKNYRLPNEAEWEYAARAGTTTRYWWGDQASHDYANYGKNICCDGVVAGKDVWAYTAPVGSFPPNQFGLHEIAGNVWEWTGSIYKNSYAEVAAGNDSNDNGAARVARGGAWNLVPKAVRSAYRSGFAPQYNNSSHGFRVARDVE